jgi:hypothetical protein
MPGDPRLRSATLAAILVFACGGGAPEREERADRSCTAPAVRDAVERFGERLRRVSLLAPESLLVREIETAYAPFVTSRLLETWKSDPSRAPGRQTSSPWPARLEVRSVQAVDDDVCRVAAEIVYASSADGSGSPAAVPRQPIALSVTWIDGWKIAAWDAVGPASTDSAAGDAASPDPAADVASDAAAAADVVRRYYAALSAGDHRAAYALWGDSGRASRQTFDQFAAGYRETARVDAAVGTPGRTDAAAGSRYVEVPVVVTARTTAGEEQRFEGGYVLRRSVVDGATPEQRRWHIHSATLRRVP